MTCSAFQLCDTRSSALAALDGADARADAAAIDDTSEPIAAVEAPRALSELFGQPLPVSPWISSGGVRFIGRWRHGGRRGYLPPMRGHLITATHVGSGLVILSRDGRRIAGQLRRGAVSILPEGCHGDVDFTGERECSQVIVPASVFRQCVNDAALPESTELAERITVVDPTLFHLVDMLTADDTDPSTDEMFREQCAALICTHLVRRHSRRDVVEQTGGTGLAGWQLRRIQEYMQEHLHTPLTLSDIATQVTLSRHYVCTAFRHSTGFTPYEYLTTLRIGRAKELLTATRQSVSDIAAAVGYGTPSAFTASFRRATGTTPSRFRAK